MNLTQQPQLKFPNKPESMMEENNMKPVFNDFNMFRRNVSLKTIQAREQWCDVTCVEFEKLETKMPQEILIDVSLKQYQVPKEISSLIFSYLRYTLHDFDNILMNSKNEDEILDILCLIRKQMEKGQKETINFMYMPNFTTLLLFYLTTLIKKVTLAWNETINISLLVIKNGTPQFVAKVFDQKFLIGLTEVLGSETAGNFAILDILNLVHHWLALGEVNPGNNLFTDKWEECGGLEQLDQLQRHDSERIYEKAVVLLKTFFSLDEE